MCDPVTIGSAVLTAAGTMYNSNTQKKAAKAQRNASNNALAASNQLRDAERGRQDAFAAKTRARFDENLGKKTLENQETQLDSERQRVETLYNENIPDATTNNSLLSGQQNAGANFDTAAAKSLADSSADTRRRLNALARLQSYGGSQQLNDFARISTNRDIGTTANNAGNSLATNSRARNSAMRNPAQVTSGSTTLGDIMMGAGQAGMFAGAAGWNPFGGASTGAAGLGSGTNFNGGGISVYSPMKPSSFTPIAF
jgi:hypothetical protein